MPRLLESFQGRKDDIHQQNSGELNQRRVEKCGQAILPVFFIVLSRLTTIHKVRFAKPALALLPRYFRRLRGLSADNGLVLFAGSRSSYEQPGSESWDVNRRTE